MIQFRNYWSGSIERKLKVQVVERNEQKQRVLLNSITNFSLETSEQSIPKNPQSIYQNTNHPAWVPNVPFLFSDTVLTTYSSNFFLLQPFLQERSYGRYRNTGDNPLLKDIDSSGQEFRKRRKKSIPLVSELVRVLSFYLQYAQYVLQCQSN